MAFKPDKLREEITAAEEKRNKHLGRVDDLVKQFHTGYWSKDAGPTRPSVANHAYEYLSIMVPGVVYDAPRVRVRSANPSVADAFGIETMGDRAAKIQAALNQWSINDRIAPVLRDGLIDFYFAYCVWMVTMTDHPGWQGHEFAPQKPYLACLDRRHFVMDAAATNCDPMRMGGPRFMGHMWKTDREDLLNDPLFDRDQVTLLGLDSDVEKFNGDRHKGADIPSRDEVVCWDIWVPEQQTTNEPGYNGTVYTIAACSTSEGIGKKSYYIRPPQPAFGPPWGRYIVSGYLRVPGSAYPLSPLVATAEQAEEVNLHLIAAAEDAANYKRFGVYDNKNQADGQRAKNVRHGTLIGLDEPKSVTTHELGGVSDTQYKYNDLAEQRLHRVSGLSSSTRGEPDPDATATAESIAKQGSDTRLEGIKAAFREGVAQVFRTAAWDAHYGERFKMSLGQAGDKLGSSVFMGGVNEGMEEFDYFDLTLNLEPYSMGHTDHSLIQRRIEAVWAKIVESAPVMEATPWIEWPQVFRSFMEVFNFEDADEWLNEETLMHMQVMRAVPPQPEAPGQPGAAVPQGGPPVEQADAAGAAMPAMQEQAAVTAAEMGGV